MPPRKKSEPVPAEPVDTTPDSPEAEVQPVEAENPDVATDPAASNLDTDPDIAEDGFGAAWDNDPSDAEEPDDVTAKAAAKVEPEGDEYDANDEGQTVGTVDLPCRVHYPNGWPVEELGAWANCPHGHGIRYGEQVEISRERAVELGFLEADPT